jgi:anti-sigma factor RsiW
MIPYLDGELHHPEMLDAHLSTCPHCRQELEDLRRSFAATVLAAREQEAWVHAPPDLMARLQRRLDEIEEYSHWIAVARALRWLGRQERLAVSGCVLALVLLSVQLSSYVQVDHVEVDRAPGRWGQETQVRLRVGELFEVTLMRRVG